MDSTACLGVMGMAFQGTQGLCFYCLGLGNARGYLVAFSRSSAQRTRLLSNLKEF